MQKKKVASSSKRVPSPTQHMQTADDTHWLQKKVTGPYLKPAAPETKSLLSLDTSLGFCSCPEKSCVPFLDTEPHHLQVKTRFFFFERNDKK